MRLGALNILNSGAEHATVRFDTHTVPLSLTPPSNSTCPMTLETLVPRVLPPAAYLLHPLRF